MSKERVRYNMKKLLTLVLCWLLAFSAMAETTLKAKTALSAAGGYLTSLNKVDGSFEDGIAGWVASTDTIVQTASTEFQGNNIGVWSGTGSGTLSLQWTATASNTYEASAQVDVQGEDDVYICAYVGTTETGCKLIPALSKIQKVSVVADSVMSSAFYLRLKHTGSDAFSVKVDDGKIEPWTPQAVNLVEEGVFSADYTSIASSRINFNTNAVNKNFIGIFADYNATTANFTAKKSFYLKLNATAAATNDSSLSFYVGAGLVKYGRSQGGVVSSYYKYNLVHGLYINAGESFSFAAPSGSLDTAQVTLVLSASAISENVVQSWQDGTEPTAFTPTGSWSSNTTYSGTWFRTKNGTLKIEGKVAVSGAPTATSLSINLPFGLAIDTVKLGGTDNRELGRSTILDSGSTYYQGRVQYNNTTSVSLVADSKFSSNNYSEYMAVSNSAPMTWANGDYVTFSFEVPIVGWSSSTPTLIALPTSKIMEFSSYVNSSGTVSGENVDFINGNTSVASNVHTGTWTSGIFNEAPNCVAVTANGSTNRGVDITTSASGFVARTEQSDVGTAQASHFRIFCQKTGSDYTAPGVFISNLNPDGFNRTNGTTGLIDNFSFSYGTTNATTVCSASPCSYLDQIGNYVTSVTRGGAGNYTAVFSKTFTKVKCTQSGLTATSFSGAQYTRCENCSSMQFYTGSGSTAADTYGNLMCQGY